MGLMTLLGAGVVAAGGGTPVTVYGPTSLPSASAGWQGYTVVHLIPAASLGAATGNTMRVTTIFTTFPLAGTLIGYIGQAAASGDAYDFNATPAQVLWGGVGIVIGDGSTLTYTSDYVTLPEAYDHTKNYLFAFAVTGGSAVDIGAHIISAEPGEVTYYKSGNDASTVNKTGYTTFAPDDAFFVSEIGVL